MTDLHVTAYLFLIVATATGILAIAVGVALTKINRLLSEVAWNSADALRMAKEIWLRCALAESRPDLAPAVPTGDALGFARSTNSPQCTCPSHGLPFERLSVAAQCVVDDWRAHLSMHADCQCTLWASLSALAYKVEGRQSGRP